MLILSRMSEGQYSGYGVGSFRSEDVPIHLKRMRDTSDSGRSGRTVHCIDDLAFFFLWSVLLLNGSQKESLGKSNLSTFWYARQLVKANGEAGGGLNGTWL
jgi:hypothetical protein